MRQQQRHQASSVWRWLCAPPVMLMCVLMLMLVGLLLNMMSNTSHLKSDLAVMESTMMNAEHAFARAKDDIKQRDDRVREALALVKESKQQCDEESQSHTTEIGSLKDALHRETKDHKRARQAIQELSSNLELVQSEAAQLKDKVLAEVKPQIDKCNKGLLVKEEAVRAMVAERQQLQREVKELQAEMSSFKESSHARSQGCESRLLRLEAEIRAKDERLAALAAQPNAVAGQDRAANGSSALGATVGEGSSQQIWSAIIDQHSNPAVLPAIVGYQELGLLLDLEGMKHGLHLSGLQQAEQVDMLLRHWTSVHSLSVFFWPSPDDTRPAPANNSSSPALPAERASEDGGAAAPEAAVPSAPPLRARRGGGGAAGTEEAVEGELALPGAAAAAGVAAPAVNAQPRGADEAAGVNAPGEADAPADGLLHDSRLVEQPMLPQAGAGSAGAGADGQEVQPAALDDAEARASAGDALDGSADASSDDAGSDNGRADGLDGEGEVEGGLFVGDVAARRLQDAQEQEAGGEVQDAVSDAYRGLQKRLLPALRKLVRPAAGQPQLSAFLAKVPDSSLDVVFLQLMTEPYSDVNQRLLQLSWPKLRPGGVLAGGFAVDAFSWAAEAEALRAAGADGARKPPSLQVAVRGGGAGWSAVATFAKEKMRQAVFGLTWTEPSWMIRK